MADQKMNSKSGQENPKPWLNEDFAQRFRQAFGRAMTAEERQFFGLDPAPPAADENAEAAD